MKILEPQVKLINQEDNEALHIAKCARICYASNKLTDNKKICDNLWKNNHRSMFRHAGVYYKIPVNGVFNDKDVYLLYSEYCNIGRDYNYIYISTNRQYAKEYLDDYSAYEISVDEAKNIEPFVKYKLIYYTFIIDTGIDITRELNRKSPNAISERSTRYVDFIKKIGIVFKKCHWMTGLNLYKKALVNLMCKFDEWFYKISRSKYGLNLKPEDARWCLFLDTMSKAAYTYTVRDWEYIINLRLFDYTGGAHPDAKAVMLQIKEALEDEGYDLVNYKNVIK